MSMNLNRGLDDSGSNAEFDEVIKSRAPLLKSIENTNRSLLIVPFYMAGNLRGAFRLVRNSTEKLTTRDAEVVDVFLKQIAIVLDNREMIYNREKFYLELVQTLADVIDSRDAATEGQTRRARRLARATARELSLPDEFIYYLEFAALMHDIGKIAIDESLLKKPGKLTPQEFEIIKKHPEFGHRILAPVSMLAPVAPMVLYHQEWYNGKGYPEGLSGEEIPLGARIVAILDAWGAMTSSHPWRPALSTEEAVKELRRGAGTQFDPKVVEAFVAAVEKQARVA
jgi:HD-GYP domain-containing protein (c-di-GMP phosphodiesterase class II)